MSKLIIVCGLPGSGKTTLANALSTKLGMAVLHKDSIKEVLYDKMEMSSLEDSLKVGKISIQLLLSLAEEQVHNNADIILEGVFSFSGDAALFHSWEQKYKLDITTIICSIEPEERSRRFKDRPRHEAHHDAERTEAEDDENKALVYDSFPGKIIKIITNKPTAELIENIPI